MAIPHGKVKLGKKAARRDPRTLEFARYVEPPLPAPPDEVSWVTKVPSWPMHLNDQLGDCVIAGMAHSIEQWTFYAGKPVLVSDADVLVGYEKIGGYVPGDPSTDQGCVMLDALKYWRNTGLAGHRILAFVAVDPLNLVHVRQAIQLFGNLFLGLALPLAVQGKDAWTVPEGGPNGDGAPGSWGGHCVTVMASSQKTHTSITWGERLKMSHNFLADYCDEMYSAISTDWIAANGLAPSQFNLKQLESDLRAVQSLPAGTQVGLPRIAQ